jgi:hypothetical protein
MSDTAPAATLKTKDEHPGTKRKKVWAMGRVGRRREGWRARYLKEVDGQETTLRFWQEVYDDAGPLVESHEKFPVDKGH